MMQYWCSDIDGVLIDSRELVRQSYRNVGVIMPDEAWGHPWRTWLPDAVGSLDKAESLHARKTEAYIDVLASGAVVEHALPFASIAVALQASPGVRVFYVTGAAEPVAKTILTELGLDPEALLAAGISTDDRLEVLKSIAATGTYIDDRQEGREPALAAGWKFIWAQQEVKWTR